MGSVLKLSRHSGLHQYASDTATQMDSRRHPATVVPALLSICNRAGKSQCDKRHWKIPSQCSVCQVKYP